VTTSAENRNLYSRGIFLNVISMAIMNLAPLINKFALGYIDAISAAFYNTFFVLLFSYLAILFRGRRVSVKKAGNLLWIIGFFDALGVIFLYASLDLISPVMVGFLGRLYTVFAVVLSIIFLKERIGRRESVLMGIAILGLFMFVTKGLDFSNALGIMAAIAYTFCFAVSNLLAKMATATENTNDIIFYNKFVSFGFVFAYSVLTGRMEIVNVNWIGIGYVFFVAFFCNFIGLILFYNGLQYVEFNLVNLIRSVGPILVVLYSWYFFPEPLSLMNIVGGFLLLASVTLLTTKNMQLKHATSKEPV
jgi:drug/metabolite transporter (DMT)-like permease